MLTLPISNTTSVETTAVALRRGDPARHVALTTTLPLTLPFGSAASVPFTFTTATPLGLWRVDTQLQALGGVPLDAMAAAGALTERTWT